MPPGPLETLREVNRHLGHALLSLRPERTHCSAITARDFDAILDHILRASQCLRDRLELPPDLQQELLVYRDNLERLKQLLPDLQGRLLAEKARLESARSQLTSAEIWARASKMTL